jgi:hypothetical protein
MCDGCDELEGVVIVVQKKMGLWAIFQDQIN